MNGVKIKIIKSITSSTSYMDASVDPERPEPMRSGWRSRNWPIFSRRSNDSRTHKNH